MKIAYLTCELKSRDLDSRLLIAGHLLKKGISVAVGQLWSLHGNIENAPKGVFLLKTANKAQGRVAVRCKAAAHSVVMSDEEMVALTNEDIERMITDETALKSCDIFLAQDEHHARLVKSIYPDCPTSIVGNSRVDLLLSHSDIYKPEAAAIKAPRGRFVLVNTNFTLNNSLWGTREYALEVTADAGGADFTTEGGRALVKDWVTTERANIDATIALLNWMIRNLAGWRLVVRPHPAENPDTWRSLLPGIEVVVGTNPVPWMMASDLVVHTNSTTGLEAALLGVPCLNLCPVPRSETARSYITRKVNATVTSVSAATQAIESYLKRGQGILAKAPAKPPFPAGAAAKTADAICSRANDTSELKEWSTADMSNAMKTKFSLTLEELLSRLDLLFPALGVTCSEVMNLDDSLFLLKP